MRRRAFMLLAVTGLAAAQSRIDPPLAGYIRCDDGKLRPVYGVAGSFFLGAPVFAPVRERVPQRLRTELSFPGGARLFSEEGDLVYREADGVETRTRLGAPAVRIERMSAIWIHVRTAGRSFSVRLESGRIEAFRLPEVAE